MNHKFLQFLNSSIDQSNALSGRYDPFLVILSILVATIAAHAALQIAERILTDPNPRRKKVWLSLGAIAMGTGIWAMHFVGMLAFQLPATVNYDIQITLLSVIPGILASGVALFFMSKQNLNFWRINLGGVLMGLGIGSMHYTGMAAMIMDAAMYYDPVIFVLSILVAHILATFALFIRFMFAKKRGATTIRIEICSAFIMGCAVAGMHYTGMAAAKYFSVEGVSVPESGVSPLALGLFVAFIAVALLTVAILSALMDKRITASEDKAQLILESTAEGIFGLDVDSKMTFLNPAALQMLGYTKKELIGQSAHLKIHCCHDVSPNHSREECPLCSGKTGFTARSLLETTLVKKDGSELPVEYSKTPINKYDNIIGAVVAFNDITEKKIAQKKEKENSLLLAGILETANDAVISIDESQKIIVFNTGAEEIFGYQKSEVIGQSLNLLLPQEVRYKHQNHITNFSASPTQSMRMSERTKGLYGCRKNGEEFPIDASISKYELGSKKIYTVVLRDKTESVLVEQKLRKAKEAAEAGNLAKSEFLATMSHEIRTPMNGVIGMTNILLDTNLNKEQRENAKMIQSSAEVLLNIINQILDFSKIEAGKLELENAEFDLRTLLDEVSDLLAFNAHEKGLAFACFITPDIDNHVIGDPVRIRQIIINLANNAIKFTNAGEVIIKGEVESETDTEMWVRFTVQDSGIGIPKKAIDRLFQSFSQVDASHTRKYGGTGLGLAISKQIAELMGGEIGVESKENKGSTFWFTLCLKKRIVCRERPQNGKRIFNKKCLLIVDGNATQRKIIRLQSHFWGLEFIEASNVRHARSIIKKRAEAGNPIDFIIISEDVIDTFEVAMNEKLIAGQAFSKSAKILLTAPDHNYSEERIHRLGFDAHLVRPVKQLKLRACFLKLLGEQVTIVDEHELPENGQPVIDKREPNNTRILLVEDNKVNQKIALKMLEKIGYPADLAINGLEALRVIEKVSYDIILMDCQMPEMDGFEATRIIRAQENGEKRMTIIALTANAIKGDREKCIAAGMDDYLTKPVVPKAFEEMLDKWTKISKNARKSLNG